MKFLAFFKKKKNSTDKTTSIPNLSEAIDINEEAVAIKGNINKKGEKIYHTPEGKYYNVTNASELFTTEEEAEKAGYRRSRA